MEVQIKIILEKDQIKNDRGAFTHFNLRPLKPLSISTELKK